MTTVSEIRSIRKGLDKLRAEVRALFEAAVPASRDAAVKRSVAAKLCGMSGDKLDGLIHAGKVKTTEDGRRIPMSEVRRLNAPKVKRERRPAVGYRQRQRNVDGQSDEAWEQGTRAIRAGAR